MSFAKRNMLSARSLAAAALLALVLPACVPANSFETLTPTSEYARAWTAAEAKQKVTGYTFVRHGSRGNEALFFDPTGVVYQWVSGRPTIASSTWLVDMRSLRATQSARVYLCTNLPQPNLPLTETRSRCIDPSLFFIPATASAKGDVFKLAGRKEAPADLPTDRMRIEDIAKLRAAPG